MKYWMKISQSLRLRKTASDEQYGYYASPPPLRIIWQVPNGMETRLRKGNYIDIDIDEDMGSAKWTPKAQRRKRHLLLRVKDARSEPPSNDLYLEISHLLDSAPSGSAAGRKPIADEVVSHKVVIPRDMAEWAERHGDGNISEGIRRAVRAVMYQDAKNS